MAKVAHAVEHAHQRGILHRDLKPANILFDAPRRPDGRGLRARKFRALDQGLTLPAAALGSPNYMAPEQISAQFGDIGPACDVYSLGAVLYELLTGRPPILGKDAARDDAARADAGRRIRHAHTADCPRISTPSR